MDCRRVEEYVFLYADNEMEEELLVSLREHLSLCPGCARRLDQAQRLVTLVRERCVRATAPRRLRYRILVSLPHRQGRI